MIDDKDDGGFVTWRDLYEEAKDTNQRLTRMEIQMAVLAAVSIWAITGKVIPGGIAGIVSGVTMFVKGR